MADVSYLDGYGNLEMHRDHGPRAGTHRRHNTWDLSPEDHTTAPPYLKQQTSLGTQLPIKKFSDVPGASQTPRPSVYPDHKEQFLFALTSIPPETTAAFPPPPKGPPLIRLTRVSKARALGGKQLFANQLGTLPDDRQQQQPLEYVRNPLQFRAKTNFTSPSPARNQTHSISLSKSFDPWLVRIKDVLKNESSKTDDVQPDEGMNEIKNAATVLESLPPMIVREVGKLFCQMFMYAKSPAYVC